MAISKPFSREQYPRGWTAKETDMNFNNSFLGTKVENVALVLITFPGQQKLLGVVRLWLIVHLCIPGTLASCISVAQDPWPQASLYPRAPGLEHLCIPVLLAWSITVSQGPWLPASLSQGSWLPQPNPSLGYSQTLTEDGFSPDIL